MFREEGIGEDVEAQTCAEDYKGRVQIAKLQKHLDIALFSGYYESGTFIVHGKEKGSHS